ncbi:MAG: MerR family DNA-binding transcriptional regulator [Actinomycetia bacterium]|nr:MerR family DNA-binding transcriptional regulator [Actinomycetes bacterium]
MDAGKAIPAGYLSVRQVAKRMQTTVRALQYYAREGLLRPSATSEGGQRL